MSPLDKYINSHGRELPGYVVPYQDGNTKGHLCVFCDSNHDHHEVFIINGDIGKSLTTECHCCNMCENEIEEMLEVAYGYSKSDISQSALRTPKPAYDDQNDDFELFGGMGRDIDPNTLLGEDKLDRARVQTIHHNLRRLDKYYQFPDDVYKYYIHLDPMYDRYAVSSSCCICRKPLEVSEEQFRLQVPVFPSQELTGGEVLICTYCSKRLKNVFITLGQLMKSGRLREETCARTKKKYLIENDEYVQRASREYPKDILEPSYVCPSEAYEETVLGGDAVPGGENCFPRSSPPKRYVRYEGLCKCSALCDVTMLQSYFDVMYRISIKGKGEILCDNCLIHKNRIIAQGNYVIELEEGGILLISINDADWSGILYRMDKGNMIEIGSIGESETVSEAISKALKLWTK